MNWSEFAIKLLDFLQHDLPGLLAMFGAGYAVSNVMTKKAEAKNREQALQMQYKENHEKIEKDFADKSSSDIASDVLSGKLK